MYPNEILIIDGSINNETTDLFQNSNFKNLKYFKVNENQRGLTKQRNFGISKVTENIDVVCFLDDDTVLEPDYFKHLINTFERNEDVIGVGGVAINENRWEQKQKGKTYDKKKYYKLDGYIYPEGLRNRVRNYLGLTSSLPSNCMPDFSHGRTSGYPLTGKIYEVDLLIGMSMSFRKSLFDHIRFSTYFEGYGLYEDADFSIRALNYGKNVIDTKVQLSHFHDAAGRPNMFKYGKMVLRNGWYVWRVKYSNPSFKAKFKWYAIHGVLIIIRFFNVITNNRKAALTDALGRTIGWWSLIFNKPNIK
ncbi:glycosyltransferase (GT2) [Formosa agariphila KMM 3901]|uniref:Glycosyltransferase (GT2) n=1 Tax=Formosa agariphila (strain DSM 15362 / KCTC 12365 / LMG 23005 / KMM 3901 / M-2Alg 35-1) TaxID=1347342 RepID=T2KMQ2_FORAG|nr:glycosyltransferase (GT2) [Formosa agariphila KMM 3901]